MGRALTLAVVVFTLSCEELAPIPDSGTVMTRDAGADPMPADCLGVSPAFIDFGEVEHALSGFKRVELVNHTPRLLTVHALPRSGPFSVSPLDVADVLVPPNSRRVVEVQFAAEDALLHLGAIELTAGPDCNARIDLRGLGSGSVNVEPFSLDFGFVNPGQSKTLEARITNTRRTPVTVNVLELRDLTTPGLAFTANLPSVPFELAPLSSVSFPVIATPPTDVPFEAQLVVATMFGVVLGDVRVTGGGPVAELSPAVIEVPLATFEPGAPSFVERTLTLRNVSTLGRGPSAALTLVPPTVLVEQVDGGRGEEVSLSFDFDFGFGIERGQERSFQLRVTPTSTGRRDFRVRLITNDPVQPEQVVELGMNIVTLGACSMRVEPQGMLQLTPTPDGRSRGMISFSNVGANRCVVDDVGFTETSSAEISLVDAISQFVVEPGTMRSVIVEGPRSLMRVEGALGFHVLNRDSARQFIVIEVPP